jgi:cell division protein FtsN
MEQKKILWIVVAVGVFVLVIFGTALILYSPTRSSTAAPREAAFRNQETAQGTRAIDPDEWVRNPDSKPGIDAPLSPPRGDINLTIVNGDNASAQYGVVDVTGLTQKKGLDSLPEGTVMPGSIPGQPSPGTSKPAEGSLSIQEGKGEPTAGGSDAKATANAAATTTKPSSSTVTKASPKTAAKQASPQAKKPVERKAVTEYWIQTGSFSGKLNAEKARAKLAERYITAEIFTKTAKDATSYRVRVGPYTTKKEAEYWLGTVKEIPEFAKSYISEVKAKK